MMAGSGRERGRPPAPREDGERQASDFVPDRNGAPGSPRKKKIKKLVEDEPEKAVSVLRGWMRRDG